MRRACAQPSSFGKDELVQVHGLTVCNVEGRSVGDGDGEKILDESLKVNGVRQQPSYGLCATVVGGLLELELEFGAHAGQGAPQFMAGISDEAVLSFLRVFQPGQHCVHCLGETTDLVVGRRLGDAAVEVLGADSLNFSSY